MSEELQQDADKEGGRSGGDCVIATPTGAAAAAQPTTVDDIVLPFYSGS